MMKKLNVVLNVIFSVVCAVYLTGCCGGFMKKDIEALEKNHNIKALQGFAQVQKINYDGSEYTGGFNTDKDFAYKVWLKVIEIDKNDQENILINSLIVVTKNHSSSLVNANHIKRNSEGTAKNMIEGACYTVNIVSDYISTRNDIAQTLPTTFNINTFLINSEQKLLAFQYNELLVLDKTIEIFNFLPNGWDKKIFKKPAAITFSKGK